MLFTKIGSQSRTAVRLSVRHPTVVCLCAGLMACAAGGTAAADNFFTWTGASGFDPEDFHRAANWTPAGGPPDDYTDRAFFTDSPSSAYAVTWDTDMTTQYLEVKSGVSSVHVVLLCTPEHSTRVYTLDSIFGSAFIGPTAGPLAQLSLRQVGFQPHSIQADSFLAIGNATGSNGKLVLDRFDWTGPSTLIGVGGTGELEFRGGGIMINVNGAIAIDPGGVGTVTFNGAGRWSCGDTLTVGNQGNGTIDMISYGAVEVGGDAFIAKAGGSIGNVTVSGTDVYWYNTGSLYVGGSDTAAGGSATFTVEDDGAARVVNDLVIYAGNTVILDGGTIHAGSLSGAEGALQWGTGTLHITGVHLLIDPGETLGDNPQIGSGQVLSVDDTLYVGVNTGATLTVMDGGTVTSGSGVIGSITPGSVASTLLLTGSESSWTVTGLLGMESLNGANLRVEDAATLSTGWALIAWHPTRTADVGLSGADTQWNAGGPVCLGGDTFDTGGTGELRIMNSAEMNVGGTLKIWDDFSVEVLTGGVLTTPDLDLYGGLTVDAAAVDVLGGSVDIIDADALLEGAIDIQGSVLTITGGGQFYGTILGDGNTQVTLLDSDSLWMTEPSLNVGTSTTGENRLALLTVGAGAVVTVEDAVNLLTPGALALNGGSINAPEFDLGGADFQGFGALNGRVIGGGAVITATGALTMGAATDPLGFSHGGELEVGANAVTLNSARFARSGVLTTIQTPGILAAPNGLLLDNGDNLIGNGTVIAPIAAGFGSTIVAWGEGELELGDPTARDGFFSDGVLEVGTRRVTLHDANAAVLGSVTTIGVADSMGFLVAANGAVLEFGKNLTGFGLVDTPDDPTTPLINNGAIAGNAANRLIELSGYVKGVGTLDNVTITGTDAPGFSTARVYRGNVTYLGTLEIEIGGLSPGSGHDQVNHTGTAGLGGELQIDLIDGFAPELGDRFVIMTFASGAGRVTAVSGRGDCGGVILELEYNENDVALVAVEALAADSDIDGDVDLVDYEDFLGCATGPDGSVTDECQCLDIDQSGTVDLRDFDRLQDVFTGE